MPWFFLSHAPDEDGIFVERFFHDLSAEIRRRAQLDGHDEVGYLDIATRDGTRWPIDTRAALASCQTFVALCSGKYFLTASCGRAWGVFADRLRRQELVNGSHAQALIPIVWSSDDLPTDFLAEDGISVAPHRTPGDEDLRVLLRLHRHRLAYRAFVVSLAHRIVEVARADRVPPAPTINTDALENAFDRRPRWRGDPRPPQRVHFVVCAGTRQQMASVRGDTPWYGDRAEDWSPFPEVATHSLAAHARGVAAQWLLDSVVVSVGAGMDEQIRQARDRNDVVVLLVDPWSVRLDRVREALVRAGREYGEYVAILVLSDREDAETARLRESLRLSVLRAVPNSPRRRDGLVYRDIETLSGFDQDLSRAIAEARQRIHRSGMVFRRAGGEIGPRRPILGGP